MLKIPNFSSLLFFSAQILSHKLAYGWISYENTKAIPLPLLHFIAVSSIILFLFNLIGEIKLKIQTLKVNFLDIYI